MYYRYLIAFTFPVVAAITAVHSPALACTGDCNSDGVVAVNELVKGVNIALGKATLDACSAFDFDNSRTVTVNELVRAVAAALAGCPKDNRPPVAADDAANATSGNAVEIDVLVNDSDPDGDGVGLVSLTQPAHGLVSIFLDTATYTPNILFTGEDSFTYTISDNRGGMETATVTIAVSPPPFEVISHFPSAGGSEAGVTIHPQVFFSKAVNPSTLSSNNFHAAALGQRLPATIVPAGNGLFAWLFFPHPLPNATEIMVTMDGASIRSTDGNTLDADGDGTPGGVLQFHFSTVSLMPIPGTVLKGRIVDPGPDLRPMTADDFGPGLDAQTNTADDVFLLPLAGVKVFIVGLEERAVFTDSSGQFLLEPVPVGDVKVAMDGLTATSPPAGQYFPEMVMDARMQVGVTNFVMPGMETMYLPRLPQTILQTVSASATNMVALLPEAAYDLTPEQQQFLTVEVMPNSLVGSNGQPMASGQVGISVVPPELVENMLPPGLLQHTFDITVQAMGFSNFSAPAPLTAPNVFNAPPATKLNFLSFDHTTGRLVIEGTATVSADGLHVRTDPGSGITHPGWHGVAPPGNSGGGGGGGGGDNGGGGGDGKCKDNDGDCCEKKRNLALNAQVGCALSVVTAIPRELAPEIDCAISVGQGVGGAVADCATDSASCLRSTGEQTIGAVIGCVPFIGPIGGIVYSCNYQVVDAEKDYRDCLASLGSQSGAAAAIPRSIMAEQAELWADAASLYSLVVGNPKWSLVAPSAFGVEDDIFRAVSDAIRASSDRGVRISRAENAAILALPRPANISSADAEALVSRMDQMSGGILPLDQIDLTAIAAAAAKLRQTATELKNRGWKTTYDGYLRGITQSATEQHNAFNRPVLGGGGFAAQVPLQAAAVEPFMRTLVGGAFFKLTTATDAFVQRGRVPGSGSFDQLFVAPNSFHILAYVDPANGDVALTAFFSGLSGQSFTIPRAIFVKSDSPDSDGDGLSNEAEDIVGTNPAMFSTCDDGIGDLARIQQGLDLASCGVFPTGIIASLPVPGEAKEVVLVGTTTVPQQQTAYMAGGSRGLSIVDASDPLLPILLGQLDLPGDATDVATDGTLQIAAVAANAGGLHLVDVSDPIQPALSHTINTAATQVEVVDGIAYATAGTAVDAYDLLTGDRLQSLVLAGGTLTGLAREREFLYTMDAGFVLRAVDISGLLMSARGSLAMPNGGGKLFVGNGIAYVATEGSQPGGFATADVSDPDNLTLLSDADNTSVPGKAVAANGSGLVVTVGSPGVLGNLVEVLNVTDPSNTGAFVAQLTVPSDPFSVAIGAGIGFVADGTNGLVVVNYLPLDSQGMAPVVSMNALPMSAVEGSFLPIELQVSDDVQVRNVELLVDGQVTQNDVSFPFELTASVPFLSVGSSNVTIQIRATDTGGNVGLSSASTVQIVADTMGPSVVSVDPPDLSTRGPGNRAVRILFSERLDETTVTAQSIQLLLTNSPIAPQTIQLRHDDAEVQLNYSSLGVGDYQIVVVGTAVQDRLGNSVGPANVVSHFAISGGIAEWINPAGGDWFNPTNWQGGVLPQAGQDVVIDAPGSATITFGSGVVSIRSLVSSAKFNLAAGAGILTVATTVQINNTFTLESGTLKGAMVLPGSGGQGITATSGGLATLDGVTLQANVSLSGGGLTVVNGLALNAKITMSSEAGASVNFQGTQTFGGTGEVEFTGLGCVCAFIRAQQGTLTIGPNILIHGQQGQLVPEGANGKIVHQGQIIADVSFSGITGILVNGGEISTNQSFINQGTIKATVGRINLGGKWATASLGMIINSGGGVFIAGTLDNTGSTLALDAATGSWSLGSSQTAGTIKGGTVTASGEAALLLLPGGAGTLDGVTLGTGLAVPNGFLTVKNGLTLNGVALGLGLNTGNMSFNSTAVFEGTQTLGGTGEVVFAGGNSHVRVQGDSTIAGAATLTIGPGFTIRGTDGGFLSASFGFDRFINQGTISSAVAGKTIAVSDPGGDTTLINQGTMQATNGGNLLVSWGSLINSGQLSPGNPPQTLNITGTTSIGGTYTQQVAGVLNLHIGGTTPGTGFSQLNATRTVALDGTLNLTLVNSFEPSLGDTFEIMTFASRSGQFATINGLNIGNGKQFTANYAPSNVTLEVIAAPGLMAQSSIASSPVSGSGSALPARSPNAPNDTHLDSDGGQLVNIEVGNVQSATRMPTPTATSSRTPTRTPDIPPIDPEDDGPCPSKIGGLRYSIPLSPPRFCMARTKLKW